MDVASFRQPLPNLEVQSVLKLTEGDRGDRFRGFADVRDGEASCACCSGSLWESVWL